MNVNPQPKSLFYPEVKVTVESVDLIEMAASLVGLSKVVSISNLKSSVPVSFQSAAKLASRVASAWLASPFITAITGKGATVFFTEAPKILNAFLT